MTQRKIQLMTCECAYIHTHTHTHIYIYIEGLDVVILST